MSEKASSDGQTANSAIVQQDKEEQDYKSLLQLISTEEDSQLPAVVLSSLVDAKQGAPNVFLLPGIEGSSKAFESLASKLQGHVLCFQYLLKECEECSIEHTTRSILPVSVLFA